MKHLSYLVGAFLSAALLAACGGGGANSLSPSTQLIPRDVFKMRHQTLPAKSCTVCIYVSNAGTPSVTVYAFDANGNSAPIRTISGSRTRLNDPVGIALGAGGNMYVANAGSNRVTVYGPGANGNAAPIRSIAGSNTGLNLPYSIAFDRSGTLFVGNGDPKAPLDGSITVYAPGAHGNVSPTRTISGSNTGLDSVRGIALDANGRLEVVDVSCHLFVCNSDVKIFAPDATGNVAPIGGRNFGLKIASGIALDANGNVFLSEAGWFDRDFFVSVYSSGLKKKISRISGSKTQLNFPSGIALGGDGGAYVANAGSVTVYAPDAKGNVAPLRTISGSNTGLNAPRGIAVR
jgi:hypothetical protein